MKEILIASGKGGTGKTTISACFAQLSRNSVFCDCDVDAANLHLLLAPEVREQHEFYAGWLPEFDIKSCTLCGKCQRVCRFDAITMQEKAPALLHGMCEGCGVCFDHCPNHAVKLDPRHCGRWYSSQTEYGLMFHAELFPGEENSGKLIAELRKAARLKAEELQAEYLLSDGPPGIGCPVISAMSGADMLAAVTEPTPSGLHDLKRLMNLAQQFEVPVRVIINKWDLNEAMSKEIAGFCREKNCPVIGYVSYDPVFSRMLKANQTVLSQPDSRPAAEIKEIWNKLKSENI